MAKKGFMPDYGPKWWLQRWLMGILWRWFSKKPPVIH